jgi:hypothetical protein
VTPCRTPSTSAAHDNPRRIRESIDRRAARSGASNPSTRWEPSLFFEVLRKPDVPKFREALAARNKSAIAAGGKNGTLGRFLARQQRQNRGLQQLTVFDRQGTVVARVGEPGTYAQASFSLDGSRLAVIKRDPDSDAQDVWAFDIATGRGTAVTSDAEADSAPVWSPDGRHIAYVSVRANTHGLYRRASNGQGSEELLYQHSTGAMIVLTDWSADGRFLGFWSGDTMYILPLTGERKAIELGRADFSGGGRRRRTAAALNLNRRGAFRLRELHRRRVRACAPRASNIRRVECRKSHRTGNRRHRVAEGRTRAVLLSQPPRQTVMAGGDDRRRDLAGAARRLSSSEPGRRARAPQQRQQSRRSALRVRRERPEADAEVSPASAGPGPSIT